MRAARHQLGIAVAAGLALLPLSLFVSALTVELPVVGWLGVGATLLAAGASSVALWLAACRTRIGAVAGSALLALALVWQLREWLWVPHAKVAFAGAWISLAAALVPVGRIGVDARPRIRWGWSGVVSGVAALALVVGLYRASELHRWIFLHHARPLSAPLFLLLGGDLHLAIAAERGLPPASPPTAGDGLPPTSRFAADAPSVVFVLVDTLRADALRAWGGRERLPVLDSLANDGTRFEDVLVNAGWTKPSVTSMFTGLRPEEHGVRLLEDGLAERHWTLAERFHDAGYATAAFVTNYQIGPGSGLAQGFEEHHEVRTGDLFGARADDVRRRVERWLDARTDHRPLFLYLHFLDPHTPYLSGEESRFALPALRWPAYRAEVRHVDAELGPLVTRLRRQLGRLVVFVTSDHGEELGDHGDFGHGHSLYREIVRTPALLAGDGIPSATIAAPLEARDFYDLLPRFAQGPVDVGAWAAAAARDVRTSFLHFSSPHASPHRAARRVVLVQRIETSRWIYLRSIHGPRRELYDRLTDPLERRNLIATRPEILLWAEGLWAGHRLAWSPSTPAVRPGGETAQLRALGYL